MKTFLNPQKLTRLTLVLGVAGFTMRRVLYAVAVDRKHLLISHPLGFALGAVTLAAMVLIIAGVLRWDREPVWPLWPDTWNAITLITSLGFASVLFAGDFAESRLLLVRNILAVLSILSLLLVLLLKKQGKAPSFALYGILCLFFAVHLVSCYQGWSSDPQILNNLFTLLANVGLMLYFYHKAAALVDFRQEKRMLALGLLAAFFSFVALSGTDFPILYLCGGYWVLADVSEEFSGELPENLPQDPSGE